ncbi:MAG: PEP-CTERM sorting domain-containing protein [Gemmatimonas sp.]
MLPYTNIPEPATATLMFTGLIGVGVVQRRPRCTL